MRAASAPSAACWGKRDREGEPQLLKPGRQQQHRGCCRPAAGSKALHLQQPPARQPGSTLPCLGAAAGWGEISFRCLTQHAHPSLLCSLTNVCINRQVLATDGNEQQLRHAAPAPNVTYQHGDAHSIPLQDSSADLVTAASALHWFELPRFYREVRRVLKPHGCLAAWAIPLVSGTNSASCTCTLSQATRT